MKCPNCKTEMEPGVLVNNGGSWIKQGIRSRLLNIGAPTKVVAYKCSQCGKIELFVERKN